MSRRRHDSRTRSTEMPPMGYRESRADQPSSYEQPQEDPDHKSRWESSNPVRTTNRDIGSISGGSGARNEGIEEGLMHKREKR